MSQNIRFAIIGTPSIANAHIAAIKDCSKIEDHYIYSRDINRSNNFAQQYGLIPAKSYDEILANKNIHAVFIITEPHRHANLAIKAIKQKKHVLIEKPLDSDLNLAQKVLEESQKALTVTSVVSQNRFDPIYQRMRKKLLDGAIGKPYLTEIQLLWKRTDEYYNFGNGWRGQYGNVLINQAIHYIDLAIWLFGPPINIHSFTRKIRETISCYDTGLVTMEFSNKMFLNLSCCTACYQSEPTRFTIFGTKGKLDYEEEKQSSKNYLQHLFSSFGKKRKSTNQPSLFHHQIYDFLDAINSGRAPEVKVEEAYEVLKVINLCDKPQ